MSRPDGVGDGVFPGVEDPGASTWEADPAGGTYRRVEADPVTHEAGSTVTHDVTHGVTHEQEKLPTVLPTADSLLPTDLNGWTLCHDSRGIHKAVKRMDGKLKSVYVGKDPEKAAEKIRAWLETHGAEGRSGLAGCGGAA
ncbi:MAG: hypothetical protein V1792_28785 [Pseudomonadota bacterium]